MSLDLRADDEIPSGNAIDGPISNSQAVNRQWLPINNLGLPPQTVIHSYGNTTTIHINQGVHDIRRTPRDINREKANINVPSGLVSEKVCLRVAELVSSTWMTLGHNLDLTENQIDTIRIDYQNYGCEEQCYRMLLFWREKIGSEATYKQLGRALLKCNRADVVMRFEDFRRA